jgi:hypothetical protein
MMDISDCSDEELARIKLQVKEGVKKAAGKIKGQVEATRSPFFEEAKKEIQNRLEKDPEVSELAKNGIHIHLAAVELIQTGWRPAAN